MSSVITKNINENPIGPLTKVQYYNNLEKLDHLLE